MDERACNIAAAGYAVISQYGVRRATMNDIAEAAGVSRQTVYNIFPNREALLVGVVRYHFDSKWQAIREACPISDARRDRFQQFMDKMVLESWESMQAMPHADELELELATTIREELAEIHVEAKRNLCEFLLPYEAALERRAITPRGLGEMLQHAIMGMKLSTTTRTEIESVVDTMLSCLMALTDPVD
ncbi:MAG TPA: hypothetical protein DIW45_11480 [Erythrobacter sp.]|nr:hypothetical protein [Erythrobacter sp.]